jgi:hypothetical protein
LKWTALLKSTQQLYIAKNDKYVLVRCTLPFAENDFPIGNNDLPFAENDFPIGNDDLPFAENDFPIGNNDLPFGK